jgi:hypothetical protein
VGRQDAKEENENGFLTNTRLLVALIFRLKILFAPSRLCAFALKFSRPTASLRFNRLFRDSMFLSVSISVHLRFDSFGLAEKWSFREYLN